MFKPAKRWLVGHALKKEAPDKTDWENRTSDYKIVGYGVPEHGNGYVQVQKIEMDQIVGRKEVGKVPGSYEWEPVDFDISGAPGELSIQHFYYGDSLIYTGYWSYLWGTISLLAIRRYLRFAISQRFFNARTRFRQDRIRILQELVDRDINAGDDNQFGGFGRKKFDNFFLMAEFYGTRIFNHPRFEQEQRRLELMLESLVESGEIAKDKDNDNYEIYPKSISTISNFEKEERRHKLKVLQNWLIVILTAIIAGVGIIALYA